MVVGGAGGGDAPRQATLDAEPLRSRMSQEASLHNAGGRVRWAARHVWNLDFRGKSRLVSSLPVRGLGVFELPWGQMELDLDDRVQRHMAFGTYERQEVRVVRRFVRPGATVVDVGAHVGYFTLLLARLVGKNGRVISMEPDPHNHARLRDNVMRNDVGWVDVLEAAASDTDGTTRFIPGPEGETGWGTLRAIGGRPSHQITCRRLDSVLRERGIGGVDFVKVDAEGWEPYVMVGLEPFLVQTPGPVILAEVSPKLLSATGQSPADLCDYLSQFGYERRAIQGRAGKLRHNSLFLKVSAISIAQQ